MSVRAVLFLVATLPVLHACERALPPASAPDVDTMHEIRGQANYLERIALPPGGQLRVVLVDTQRAGTAEAVLAEAVINELQGPPFAFTLQIPGDRIDDDGEYALTASLRDREGRLWFVTEDSVTASIPGTDPVELRMIGVTAAVEQEPDAQSDELVFRCNRQPAQVLFGSDEITLVLSDRDPLQLPRAVSASGARYAIDGVEFWHRGDEALLTLPGEPRRRCQRVSETPLIDPAPEPDIESPEQ